MLSLWDRIPQCRFGLVIAATLFLNSVGAAGAEGSGECAAGSAEGACQSVDCGVYMAPSTIGDYSNLGIYTAKAMKNGENVPFPEIIIPMLWRVFDKHPNIAFTDGELWDRYIWEQFVGGIEVFEDLERGQERASCFIPGVGCTVNSMLELGNIQSAFGSQFDEVVDRSSPGAGAFTPYHSSPTIITTPKGFEEGVEPGQELFATYGDSWIPWIPGVAVTNHNNFKKADNLMEDFHDWIVEHESSPTTQNEVSNELLEDMWNIMIDFPHVGPRQWEELTVLPKDWNRDRLKELKHIKEVQKQLKNAPPEGEESSSPFPLPNPPSTSTRYWADRGKVSLEFLQKEGKCQDHIRPDISKIPHAGRGGFASRDLPKGTVVGYSPLIHVAVKAEQAMEVIYNGESEHGMDRFEFRDVGYDQIEDLDELIESASTHKNRYAKQDLVLNYSFGHRNSTLLLTPYGGMVNYINHKSAHDGDGPNVRVQWPDREMVAHKPDWLGKDLDFLRDSIDKIGLSFDYVALRDIKEGEEITMDYGDEWDKAWKEHVANWVPPEDADGYVHSTKFEREYYRTPEELEEEPYPWNLHTLCTDFYTIPEDEEIGVYTKPYNNEGISNLLPCRVLERFFEDEKYTYTVELQMSEEDVVIVQGFPQDPEGVFIYDKAYSPMWHMKEAFRHKLFVPDDVFPENWMN